MTTITLCEQLIRLKAAQMARTLPIPADRITADLRVRMVTCPAGRFATELDRVVAELEAKYREAMERGEAL